MQKLYPFVPSFRVFESPKNEFFPRIKETPTLCFYDEEGKIRAGCYFGDIEIFVFDLGVVPAEIANAGSVAVHDWAQQKKDELVTRERQRCEERDKRVSSLRRELEVFDEGVRIRGLLTKGPNEGARADFLQLSMTEPFRLEVRMNVLPNSFATSMAKMHTFDVDGHLLQQEVERQERSLIEMYRQEVRRRNKPPVHPALAGLPRGRSRDE